MKIAIVDDGVGAFAALNKFKRSLFADYVVILDGHFPLGELPRPQLVQVASRTLQFAQQLHCDAVVFSSIALSVAAKPLVAGSALPLFFCEAPVVHAATYTASQVLLAADSFVARACKRNSSVIPLPLPQFAALAQDGASDNQIVAYIAENSEQYSGKFDCIALGNSSMNLYKHCFSRVFPNVQIFDSLDGVARRLRKTYKKNNRDESTVKVLGADGTDLSQKYNIFVEEFA